MDTPENEDELVLGAGTIAAIVVAVVAAVVGAYVLTSEDDGPPEPPRLTPAEVAREACIAQAKARLKAPATAQWSDSLPKRVEGKERRYLWDAHVDAQNGFGALIRTDMFCRVKCNEDACEVTKLLMD